VLKTNEAEKAKPDLHGEDAGGEQVVVGLIFLSAKRKIRFRLKVVPSPLI
jgi:hypothetical protein